MNGLGLERAAQVARAFTVYFLLVNLAEERQRVRTLRERSREGRVAESLEVTVSGLAATGEAELAGLSGPAPDPSRPDRPPHRGRRRVVVESLQRIGDLLERHDDPRGGVPERQDAERPLREEIAILWRTTQLRRQRPTVLDEVRTVAAVFDETLFGLVPRLYRELDRALTGADSGRCRPCFRPFLRWGSWVGGDRDGNPAVTAEVTRKVMAIQADHVLRGLEAGCRRVGRALTADVAFAPPSAPLLESLVADAADFPEAAEGVRKRSPQEPHRMKLLLVAERLAATREGRPGGYSEPAAFLSDLWLVQESLAAAQAARLAYGQLQDLVWQAETFGFHLASLEIRQHSSVHLEALRELVPQAAGDPLALDRLASQGWPPVSGSPRAAEVLAVLQVMRELQGRWGRRSCHRYVVSFTRSEADLVAVAALARLAVPDGSLELDVVPLFESRADLEAAVVILERYLALPGVRRRLGERRRRR